MIRYFLLLFFLINSCNSFGPKRYPANGPETIVSKSPKLSFNLEFREVNEGFKALADKSPFIEKVHHFYMDPVTRIFSVHLQVKYPLDKLLNFQQMPEEIAPGDTHDVEIAFRFSKTKNLAMSRYLGLELTKFKIDNDDYLNQFDIVLSVVQTLLANTDLTDYLLVQARDQIGNDDKVNLIREIFESNTVKVFPETKKINVKLDLSKFAMVVPFANMFSHLRLWRFSPAIYETTLNTEGVSFFVVVGEGRPHEDWLNAQQEVILDDKRTLLQVREDFYRENSNYSYIIDAARNSIDQSLREELFKISYHNIRSVYEEEKNDLLKTLEKQARKVLNRENEHFIASPEHEHEQFKGYVEARTRVFIGETKRRIRLDEQIIQGGDSTINSKPLMVKRVSQNLLNNAMNFVIDTKVGEHLLFKEAELWLIPKKDSVAFKGKLNLPLKYLLSKLNTGFASDNYKSFIQETNSGIPFELILFYKMGDNGVLGLDIKQLKLKLNGKNIVHKKTSKTQKFLIDFTKVFLAQSLANVKLAMDEEEANPEERKQKEVEEILSYLEKIKTTYGSHGDIENILVSDLNFNPMNSSGEKHILRKKDIILGDVVKFNQVTELFEIHLNPDIAFDRFHGVRHDLQLWGMNGIKSGQLNNTYLEFAVGKGLRSSEFIQDLYRKNGLAENATDHQIYYDLGSTRSSADILITLHMSELKAYVNQFLEQMVQANAIDVEEQARENPGETFTEIQHLNFDVNKKNRLTLEANIKRAVKSRVWYAPWKRRLSTDIYTIKGELELKAKKVKKTHSSLTNIVYYPTALSVNPKKFSVKAGKPSLVKKALLGILNTGAKLAFGNGLVKKVLLKIANHFLVKMYNTRSGLLKGSEFEKLVRVKATSKELLIFLNPKSSGAAFNVHFAGEDTHKEKAIKFDHAKQTVHIALTAGTMLAKSDKKELISIYQELSQFMRPIESINTKEELIEVLAGQSLSHKLVYESSESKLSYFNRLKKIIRKHDHILHHTNFAEEKLKEQALRERTSPSGAELIYIATVGSLLEDKVKILQKKMRVHELTSSDYGYDILEDARKILDQNINTPLIKAYEKDYHALNKTVTRNDPSYWTYLVYPNAYFAKSAYEKLKNNQTPGDLTSSSNE